MKKNISEQKCIKELETILQQDLFTDLVGEKPTELYHHIQAGTLQNNISERIYYLNEVVEHLQGAYNEEGIRNWFYRERTQLGQNSPLDYLSPVWKPKDKNAKKVLELAKSLRG